MSLESYDDLGLQIVQQLKLPQEKVVAALTQLTSIYQIVDTQIPPQAPEGMPMETFCFEDVARTLQAARADFPCIRFSEVIGFDDPTSGYKPIHGYSTPNRITRAQLMQIIGFTGVWQNDRIVVSQVTGQDHVFASLLDSRTMPDKSRAVLQTFYFRIGPDGDVSFVEQQIHL